MRKTISTGLILLLTLSNIWTQQLAFPTAEGFGRYAAGGRGGKVIQVTNLNDSGSGSLRAAIEQSGARTIVFLVSGTIEMQSDITISHPNITIAGQTAPGDGICLKNYKLEIEADNVIVRYLRLRRGNKSGERDDALAINDAENVIVDHCSISWGCDETVNTWHGAKNSTIQWCIISEALHHNNHGFAASLGGVNATYHHNLFANCPGRNPSIGGNNSYQTVNMDFRNNVIFNFGYRTVDGKPTSVNIVNNYFKPGPNSSITRFANIDDAGVYESIPTTAWYISGNLWEGNEAISRDNDLGVTGAKQWMVDDPVEFGSVQTDSAIEAYQKVLAGAGATLPDRDTVDRRIILEALSGRTTYGKGVVLDPSGVGGWPVLLSAPPPADEDKDGMPDNWEKDNGLDPNNDSDRNEIGADGYTKLEIYLNSLVEGCNSEPVSNISVSPTSATVDVGASEQIFTVIEPFCAGDQNVSWSSGDTTVARVSTIGLVTGVGEGSATITVTTADGGFTASTGITVRYPLYITTVKSGRVVDIYPVPFTDQLHIELGSEPAAPVDFFLYDNTGRLILHEKVLDMIHQIDVIDLKEGLYLARIAGATVNVVKPVIKVK
jgi:pectate lyase